MEHNLVAFHFDGRVISLELEVSHRALLIVAVDDADVLSSRDDTGGHAIFLGIEFLAAGFPAFLSAGAVLEAVDRRFDLDVLIAASKTIDTILAIDNELTFTGQ